MLSTVLAHAFFCDPHHRHYKWALTQMFDVRNYPYVIIVEDDLDVAPDFFSFFAMGRQVLQQDATVWCISGAFWL